MSKAAHRFIVCGLGLFAVATFGHATVASAQDGGPRIHVGGFGAVAYGKTDANQYGAGAPAGAYSNTNFAIALSAAVAERLSVSALIAWDQAGNAQTTRFEYGFATWRLTSSVDLRVGKVKHPGAIYSEVYDVGVVRPFLSLPQAVYSQSGLAFDNYDGIGLNGHTFAGRWDIGFSAYGGGGSYGYTSPRLVLDAFQNAAAPTSTTVPARDLFGGRITVHPPIAGLTLGVSGSRATAETGVIGTLRVATFGTQLEYVTDRLWVRTEVANLAAGQTLKVAGWYAEAAWFVTPEWQVAAQNGRLKDTFADPSGVPPDLDRHDEQALGLNYWLSPQFVLKLSHHWVSGNRLAYPHAAAELGQAIATSQLRPRTHLLQVGGQFSF